MQIISAIYLLRDIKIAAAPFSQSADYYANY